METKQQIRSFLFGQALADGLRITVEIILPTLIFGLIGQLESGMIISLGALCVSISDGPGPVVHKKNGMLYATLLVFVMTLITGLSNSNILSLGILVLASTFLLTMLSVYGNRAGAIGTAGLLIMILRMSREVTIPEALINSLLVLAGGVWYMVIALLFYHLTPFRPAQRALGDCINETAKYLRIKSELYNPASDLQKEYKKLLDQQVVVNTTQDAVRELLFKNRSITKESTHYGRVLVLTFTYVVDLFEDIMATWYDYASLRQKYAATGILQEVQILLRKISREMTNVGDAIHDNSPYKKEFELIPALDRLKIKIDALADSGSTIMLKKILVNLRNLGENVDEITRYFKEDLSGKKQIRSHKEYSRFVSHQKVSWDIFKNNFTFQSSVFRHSLRMMITCGAGFAFAKLISQGHHSYWILMTIIIILKPGYSLTKQKNWDRLIGTLAGGIIGLLILAFVKNENVLFAFIVFFMIGTYTMKNGNYVIMVILLTPYVLILFHFLGLGALNVASERLSDTAVASLLAFLSSYFLFPQWESKNLTNHMTNMLRANVNYLQKLKDLFLGKEFSTLEYSLIRKELFVSTANLSAALQRMLSEPKSTQLHKREIYEFVVLNHILSSNVASITAMAFDKDLPPISIENMNDVKRALDNLEKSMKRLDPALSEQRVADGPSLITEKKNKDVQLNEQLNFINKVAADIGKLTKIIAA
ncbi:MAG: FUSC family membrane protein [Ginsengibacter sp.]